MSKSEINAANAVAHTPVNLADHVDHIAAPNWFIAAFGTPPSVRCGSLFQCPVCGSSECFIRFERGKEDSLLVRTRSGDSSFCAPMDGSARSAGDDHEPGGMWVSIPMRCGKGHGWLLDIAQDGDDPAQLAVLMDDECYDVLQPEAKERWS